MGKLLTRRALTAQVVMLGVLCAMSGCAPPKKTSHTGGAKMPGDGGRPIIAIDDSKKREPFKTVLVDGAEMLQARGELGEFGGTFFDIQLGEGPKTLNGWAAYDATSSSLSDMMFAGLFTTDAYTGEVVPYMAKEMKISDDKLTYTVTLRKGLKWSDGKPITSKDVVFTWNDIIKAGLGNPSQRDVIEIDGKLPTVRAIDDLTIEFKTPKPFSPFVRVIGSAIAPEHIMGPVIKRGGNTAFRSFWGVSDAIKNPEKFVVSGMWMLDRYESGQRITFKRNPNFFMVDKKNRRLPYLDKYVINFVSDQNVEALKFEQGAMDSYVVPSRFVAHVRQLKNPKDFKIYNVGPTTSTTFIAFNLNTRKDANGKPLVDPVKSRWFNNVNFRQAIDWAVNREDLVANVLKGVGAPLYTAEGLPSIFINKSLAGGHPMDLDKAKALLKLGGFKWDELGQLIDDKGNKVEFSLLTNSGNNDREATGVNIKQDLSKLGIKVNFKPMDFNVLVGKMTEGSWETIVMGLTGSPLEPNSGANIWRSTGGLHLFNQRKVEPGKKTDLSDLLPWERDLDKAMTEGASVFGKDERQKAYDKLQQIVYEQAPLVYLYSPLQIVAVKDRIRNFDPTPLSTFHNMEEIWVKDAKPAPNPG